MAPRPTWSRSPLVAALALALVAPLAAGCSGDDEPEAAPPDTFEVRVPDTVDEVCEDPRGDLLLASGAVADGPAGVDLVRAEARLADEVLDVTWTTAGDPSAAPSPWFTVMQGTPGTVTSWELRVDQDEGGNWRTQLFTNRAVDHEVIQVEQVTTPLPIAPRVEEGSVRLTVPGDFLPPAASVAWLFGATSGDGAGAVFDDCSNLYAGGPAGTGATGPDGPTEGTGTGGRGGDDAGG